MVIVMMQSVFEHTHQMIDNASNLVCLTAPSGSVRIAEEARLSGPHPVAQRGVGGPRAGGLRAQRASPRESTGCVG